MQPDETVACPIFAMTMQIEDHDERPEAWEVTLHDSDENGDPTRLLADARVFRAHFEDAWFDLFDSVSSDLSEVAGAFMDRDRVAEVHEEALWANALVVVDYIEVPEVARGKKWSHRLIHSLARVFEGDAIALLPSEVTPGANDELIHDPAKRRALVKHWGEMGFVTIPGTNVMVLQWSS